MGIAIPIFRKCESSRQAMLLALGAAALVWVTFVRTGQDRGPWRVDETHKTSETVALRLLLDGRVHDPFWFRHAIDRGNPPFGKYVFGLAVLIAGEPLPRVPALTVDTPEGFVPDDLARPYLPLLPACRRASLFATACTIGIVVFLAARLHSVFAAILAAVFLGGHWIVRGFGATANYDALLMFLITATAPVLYAIWRAPRRSLRLAPLLGILSAAAFQTRLNGGIALAACAAVLIASARVHRTRTPLVALLLAAAVFVIVSIAINPYYWAAAPREDPSIPAEVHQGFPSRFRLQVNDLRTILDRLRPGGRVRLPLWVSSTPARTPVRWTPLVKARFLAAAIAGDVLGAVMSLGAIAFLFAFRDRAFPLLWSATILIVAALWLPLPWARYLTIVLPPLALLGGIGWAAVISPFLSSRTRTAQSR